MTAAAGHALVTGATGFVGAHLVEALAGAGWQVRAAGRRERPEGLPAMVDYRRADLVGDALDGLVGGVSHVFHLAGASSSVADPPEMQRVNVTGTVRLLEAAATARVRRVVHMSTSSVYGKKVPLPQPVPEDAEPHPGAGYAASKWEGEKAARQVAAERGLDVVVVRPTTVYGPGAVKLLASTILDAAIERFAGLRAFAVPAEPVELRLVHVADVAAACVHLARHPDATGRAFNVTSPAYPTSLEVAGIVAAELGLEVEPTDDPEPGMGYEQRAEAHQRMLAQGMHPGIMLKPERIRFLRKANRNNRLALDALRGTGFEPQVTDLAQSIPESIRWYRKQRWIL